MPKPIAKQHPDQVGRRPAFLFARRVARVALALLTLFLLAGPQTPTTTLLAQSPPPAPTYDPAQVTPPGELPLARRGHAIYQQSCAPCHGPDGLGNGPTAASIPHPVTAFADPQAAWERSPAEWFHTTKYGRIERLMPPWQNQLNDTEIWEVVAYIWSLHTNAAIVADGAALYDMSCAACHGPGGAGDGPDAEGLLPNFSDPAATMTVSPAEWLARWLEAHPEIGGEWSRENQRAVLDYMRTFSYVPPWVSGYRPGPGVVRGRITLGSAGMEELTSNEVTLDAYADFTPVATFTTTVDADGFFEFTELATDSSLVYLASTSADGIRYSSPIIRLSADAPSAETSITVYATTSDPNTIRIDRGHWIIDSQPGALLVGQILTFGSDGDRTFIGETLAGLPEPVTVGIHIPPGATQLSFENGVLGGRFQQVGDMVYDTTPLIPGQATKQIVVRYAIPYEGTGYQFSQRFLYPQRQINLLIAELPQLQADVSGFTFVGPQEFQGRTYRIWEGNQVDAGEITVNLRGLLPAGAADPRPPLGGTQTGNTVRPTADGGLAPWMAWATGGVIGVALAGVVLWAMRSNRSRTAAATEDLVVQRDELLARIAQLDDLHAQGKLGQAEWSAERALLKTKLLDIALRTSPPTQS